MKLSNLQSIINKEGISRSTHYYVYIAQPKVLKYNNDINAQTLGTLCQNIQIPGRILNVTPHMIYGAERKMPFGVQYQDVNANFICTDTFNVRRFFDEWHSAINNPFDNSFEYYNNYVTDIAIMKVDTRNYNVGVYMMQEAYPISISAQQLGYDQKEYTTCEVQFAYRRWVTLFDYQRSGLQPPTIEVPPIQGSFDPQLFYPPTPNNTDDLARAMLAVAAPQMIGFQQATALVTAYNNFIQRILNIDTATGLIPNFDKLLKSITDIFR